MATQIGTALARTSGMVPPRHSTDDLDLESLPNRLDDATLARVEAIARAPLPPLSPCDRQRFGQTLRMMLAVLPRRQADEISGELFVAAYERELAAWPNEAVAYLCEQSLRDCKWFPTISECLEILGGWLRDDEATKRRAKAMALSNRERTHRRDEEYAKARKERVSMTQVEVDGLPESMVRIGLACGALERDGDGTLRPAKGQHD